MQLLQRVNRGMAKLHGVDALCGGLHGSEGGDNGNARQPLAMPKWLLSSPAGG